MNRRFISGAECPSCGETDALFMRVGESRDLVRCAVCDYVDKRPDRMQEDKGPHHQAPRPEPPGVFWRGKN